MRFLPKNYVNHFFSLIVLSLYFTTQTAAQINWQQTNGGQVKALTISGTNHVTSFGPTRNALNVPKDTTITVFFDTDINSSTLTNNTVRINGSLSGMHPCALSYNQTAHTRHQEYKR